MNNNQEPNGDLKDPDDDCTVRKYLYGGQRNIYGPIGSPSAMAYEPSNEDPAYSEPEPEPEPIDEERQFAEQMTAFYQDHEGPYEVDSMQATIERIKEHYGIK